MSARRAISGIDNGSANWTSISRTAWLSAGCSSFLGVCSEYGWFTNCHNTSHSRTDERQGMEGSQPAASSMERAICP